MRMIMLCACILLTACMQPATPRAHTSPAYQFTIPANWQTMEELWNVEYMRGKEYNDLGVTQEIMITSARRRGDFGAWFAVASAPLPAGQTLEQVFRAAYAQRINEFRSVEEGTATIAGSAGLMLVYQRPSGEPWWQYRDVWLEHAGTVYLLSIHYLPGKDETYQQAHQQIMDSFAWR